MRKVDLHGLDINRASARILNELYAFRNSWDSEMMIVAGNGTGSLKLLVEEILDNEGYYWEYANNQHSAFIIYK